MMSDDQTTRKTFTIPEQNRGLRLDQVATELLADYSRSRVSAWIKAGFVRLDGQETKPRYKVLGGEQMTVEAPQIAVVVDQAEPIALDVVYADAALLVVNKHAGMVAHPAPGHRGGTLQNALLHYDEQLCQVPRAGLVHRLDRLTSGLLVVARTVAAHHALVAQLQERAFARHYEAVVSGVMIGGGEVDEPIGRHPVERKKMCVTDRGKHALTHYRVLHRFRAHTHVSVRLETGRTHQIRVHMAHIRYPIIGDKVYGARTKLPKQASPNTIATLQQFSRQALHARSLGLTHPVSGEWLQWEAPLPEDFSQLLSVLHEDQRAHD